MAGLAAEAALFLRALVSAILSLNFRVRRIPEMLHFCNSTRNSRDRRIEVHLPADEQHIVFRLTRQRRYGAAVELRREMACHRCETMFPPHARPGSTSSFSATLTDDVPPRALHEDFRGLRA